MLTERIIRDAKPGPKPVILWDGAVKGLGVKVFPSVQKSYVLSYRTGGRKRLATIARCTETSLTAARERAGAELVRVRDGEADPLDRHREAREAATIEEGIERFFAEVVPERLRIGKMKPKTVQEYRLQSKTIRGAIAGGGSRRSPGETLSGWCSR